MGRPEIVVNVRSRSGAAVFICCFEIIITVMASDGTLDGPLFGAMLREFEEAARIIGLERGIWRILTSPKRQIIVSCPVQMDNGEIVVFTGYRVQYNITLGPAKGGVRYHPSVTLDEVTTLAASAGRVVGPFQAAGCVAAGGW